MTTRSIDGGTVRELILVPAILTLAVTLLRLVGELLNWSPALFSKAAGGGGALVGIGRGLLAGRLWGELAGVVTISLVGLATIALAHRGWPALVKTLIAYAVAARVPVAIVMLVAILGDWGTHYDVAPPNFPAMGAFQRWVWIGLFPQLTLWIFLTVVGGMIAGSIAAAFSGKKATA